MRNQGDRQACVGFAVSAAHEWLANDAITRSVEDVIWAGHQVAPSTREETSTQSALTGVGRHRHASESAWPYGSPSWPADRPPEASKPEHQLTAPSWTRCGADYDEVAAAVTAGFAVVLTAAVVHSAWRHPDGLVDAQPGSVSRGNHAVLVVGYVADTTIEQLVFKNSWGTYWGTAGYGFMTRRYVNSFGVVAHAVGGST